MLNRENILDKTHYGLKIYAYVLRQFYPNATVLTLSGRTCRITKNPFNKDCETLAIQVKNCIAIHTDTQLKNFEGDVFDFAQLYFKTNSENKLLSNINEVLNLRLETEKVDESDWLNKPDDTWYALCSFYKAPIRNVFPHKTLKMHEIHSLIKSDTYKDKMMQLRAISDPKEQRKFKSNQLDYITFSGVFERRNDSNLTKHSSLLTIDFDHLQNVNEVKKLLLDDEYFETELLFISPSGNGLKWIIKIDLETTTHQAYFKAISNYIQQKYKLEVDQSGKDISRACFLSYDPEAFLNKKYSAI